MPLVAPLLFAAATSSCSLDLAIGVPNDEAMAVAESICAEVQARGQTGERRVRVAKLGSQYVVRLVSEGAPERHLVVRDLEEVPVAAHRLVEAAATGVTVAETRDVDNVVSGETRPAKAMSSRVNVYLGIVGAGTRGADPSAGGMLGVSAGSGRWTFSVETRLTGDAFVSVSMFPLRVLALGLWKPTLDAPSSFGSLSAGVRHHFTSGETAPFVGMGLGLMNSGVRSELVSANKNGLGLHAEAGLDFLRTRTVGGAFVLRFDAPTHYLAGAWRPFLSAGFAVRL